MKDTKQRVTLFLDPVIVKKAKIHANMSNKSMSSIVEESLEKSLPGVLSALV